MQIIVYYQNGKLDVFSTDNFTANEPWAKQGLNLATELTVRLDLLDDEGLIIDLYWYDGSEAGNAVETPDDDTRTVIRHALRRQGRRIRLVSQEELEHIAQITIDGELAVWRQGGYLINGVMFKNQELLCFSNDSVTSMNRRASSVFEYLKNANPGISEETLSAMMGYPLGAMRQIKDAEAANSEEDDDDDFDE